MILLTPTSEANVKGIPITRVILGGGMVELVEHVTGGFTVTLGDKERYELWAYSNKKSAEIAFDAVAAHENRNHPDGKNKT